MPRAPKSKHPDPPVLDGVQLPDSALADAVNPASAADRIDETIATAQDELTLDVLDGLRALEVGAGVGWEVHRVKPESQEGYLGRLSRDELTFEHFREHWGAGVYRILGRLPTGKYIRGTGKTIKISGPPVIPAAHGAAGGDGLIASFLEAQSRRERERDASRKDMLLALGPALITACSSLLTAFVDRKPDLDIAALITALRPRESSLTELATAMAQLKTLQPDATSGVETALAVLDRIQDLPQGKGETGWLAVIKELLKDLGPAAGDLVKMVLQARARAAMSQPSPSPTPRAQGAPPSPATIVLRPPAAPPAQGSQTMPSGTPSAATDTTPSTPIPSAASASAPSSQPSAPSSQDPLPPSPLSPGASDDMRAALFLQAARPWIEKQSAHIEDWARDNMDVELCADMLLKASERYRAMLPDGQLEIWLASADWWQRFVLFWPAIGPYQGYVERLRETVIDFLAQEREEAGAPEPPPDDSQHIVD